MEVSKNIIFQTRYLAKQIERQMRHSITEQFGKHATGVQFFVLRLLLDDANVMYQKDIEEKMGIRRSTATEIINNMEKSGLLKRCFCDLDKRRKRLHITEEGKNQTVQFKNMMKELTDEIYQEIPEEELKTCLKVLDKMHDIMKKSQDERGNARV